MTVDPRKAPDTPENITIEFDQGVAVKVTNDTDGTVKSNPLDVFLYLNEVGSRNGIGRLDLVENRYVGIKSRGAYETPGGTILRNAHIDLEGLTLDREVRRIRDQIALKFSDLVWEKSHSFFFVCGPVKFEQKGLLWLLVFSWDGIRVGVYSQRPEEDVWTGEGAVVQGKHFHEGTQIPIQSVRHEAVKHARRRRVR